jgi:hypothetical protein
MAVELGNLAHKPNSAFWLLWLAFLQAMSGKDGKNAVLYLITFSAGQAALLQLANSLFFIALFKT